MWPLLFSWLLAAAAGSPADAARAPLLVSAAVSLTEALTECGRAFTAATGVPVRFNFGASNALARQIARGAPVDVFVSADEAQMHYAASADAIEPGTLAIVATNQLVIVVPGSRAPRWNNPSALVSRSVRRIAVGDPEAVPAGVYAKEWLQRVGLWEAAQSRLVPAATVRGALAAVSSGAADTGIVYRTDAASADVSVVFEVTGATAPAILYPAAVVRQSHDKAAARRFVQFLRGPAAQEILRRRGFGPAGRAGTR